MELSVFSGQPLWSARMADSIMQRKAILDDHWNYTAGVAAKGIEQVGIATGDARYEAYVKTYIDAMVNADGQILGYRPDDYNLDHINAGKVLFYLYQTTGDQRYKTALDLLRQQLRHHPRNNAGGFWHKQVYPHQMWLDSLYMGPAWYAQYAATFNEPEAFDDVALQFTLAFEHTRDATTGLLYHAWDAAKQQPWANPQTGCSPHFWARAMGWYVMAAVDVLDNLPAHHLKRPTLIHILQTVIPPLATVQHAATGLWYQVLDLPDRPGNYLEASASCMFVYAIAKGVRQGYLDRSLFSIAEKAYAGILQHLIGIDAQGRVNLHFICKGAGLGKFKPDMEQRDGSFEYYISEPIVTNDYKGTGAFILASLEMERHATA